MENSDRDLLRRMAEKITQIESRAQELQQLGKGLPAVEKNARDILHTVYVLKFGISDIADIEFS
ncbi:MAG: hypothetical protein AMJ54_07870 [Deltaproteobacteria bacterium SG8_13]|nr:MAG: hypothetical protein AMJ54_07870 [Deltaproteobacteria bacterium SG8_13]